MLPFIFILYNYFCEISCFRGKLLGIRESFTLSLPQHINSLTRIRIIMIESILIYITTNYYLADANAYGGKFAEGSQ